jgi:hypothetical protein
MRDSRGGTAVHGQAALRLHGNEALAARRRVVESERAGLCQIRIKNRWFANPAGHALRNCRNGLAIVAMSDLVRSAVVTLRQLGVAAIFAQARAGSRERRQHIAADTSSKLVVLPGRRHCR